MADAVFLSSGLAPQKRSVVAAVAFLLACAVVALTIWAPVIGFLPLIALVAIPCVWWVFQRPLLNLCTVLSGFVLVADYTDGLDVREVLFGLYFGLYIGHWFFTRIVLHRAAVLPERVSKAMLLFLLSVTLSAILAVSFYDTPLLDAVREWRMVFMLALFFPVRDAIERYRGAVSLIGITITLVWAYIALRNVLDYRSIILNAVYMYQLGRGRVMVNDNVMMVSSVCLATWALFAVRFKTQVALGAVWTLCFAALILTQSRAYWVAFAVAMGVLALVSPWNVRKRMLLVVVAGGMLVAGAGGVLFADQARTIAAGLVNRFASIGSATTGDISFLSRYYEARGALARVPEALLLGHGPGAYFTFTDIIERGTAKSNLLHNGYVSLLFKYGLLGSALALALWAGAIWNGLRAFRLRGARPVLRLAGLSAALCLGGYVVSALGAPPFHMDDNTFNMGLLAGVATGALARARFEQTELV